MRRSAPAAGVDAPEISLLRALYQVSRAQGKRCMSETLSTDDETMTAEPETGLGRSCDHRSGAATDLRRVGINPNFWYPVAVSGERAEKKTFAATFAGERIALYRGDSGTVYALEDRCAHRQVPLSMGVVEGDVLRCCYHGLGLSRERPDLADTVPAPGGCSPAARCPRLSGPRGLRPRVRLPGRPA